MLLNLYCKDLGRKSKKLAQLYPIHNILPRGKATKTRAEKAPDIKVFLLSVVD